MCYWFISLATLVTSGAALPIITAWGTATGVSIIGYGAYNAATSKTDGEAKQTCENIGNGMFAILTSVVGAKSSLNSASNAGVTASYGSKNKNLLEAFVHNFKILPEALKICFNNSKENISIWSGGTIFASSNKLFRSSDFNKLNDKEGLGLVQFLDSDVDIQPIQTDSLEIAPEDMNNVRLEEVLICKKGKNRID